MTDLVGPPEIATLLGVSRGSARRYVEHPTFPPPVARIRGNRMWAGSDVEKWARATLPLPGARGREAP
jgi:predicted DNA-binding transcriptional regulator AlpA